MEMLSPHLPHDTRSLRLGILLRSSHSLPFSAFANRHLIGSLASCAAQVGNAKESGITTPSLKSADAGFPPMLNGSTSGEYMGGSKKNPIPKYRHLTKEPGPGRALTDRGAYSRSDIDYALCNIPLASGRFRVDARRIHQGAFRYVARLNKHTLFRSRPVWRRLRLETMVN